MVTIIDGGGAANKHRGVYINSGGTIEGFTVRNGYLPSGGPLFLGAGICLEPPSGGTVTNCIVRDNYIGRGRGAGIYIGVGCIGKIDNCQIYSNTAFNGVGGVYAYYSSGGTRLNNCVIWGNKVTAGAGYAVFGGGIVVSSASLSMRNCLVYSNSLPIGQNDSGGGGLFSNSGNLSMENCTITKNTSEQKGGGIYIAACNAVRNSIIYDNFTTNVSVYPDVYTTNNQLTNCCIGDTNGVLNWNTSGNITNNPVFVDAAGYNYRLTPSSPCINTGTNQSWMTNGVDLDGAARIRYERVDMGAYEKIYEGTIYRFY
ncbi:MAG: right-handed parallel beta-helix repeat-containing protein [Verrucomicrobiota bacterium]